MVPLSSRWQQNILSKYAISVEILITFTGCCSICLNDSMKRDMKIETLTSCAMAINEDLSRELRSSFVSF